MFKMKVSSVSRRLLRIRSSGAWGSSCEANVSAQGGKVDDCRI
jgi:hypothetical protein